MRRFLILQLLPAALVGLSGCSDSGGGPVGDAWVPPDGPETHDARPSVDADPPQAAAEIAVSQCPEWRNRDGGVACTGRAPLSLTFVAVTSQGADSFLWDVGDGSETMEGQTVAHTHHTPGTFDVSVVVAGSFGAVQAVAPGLVETRPAQIGGYCEQDQNCGSGLCLCRAQTNPPPSACPAALRGTCVQFCDTAPCDEGVCVDLRPGLAPSDPTQTPPWRAPLCLKSCQSDWDCVRPAFFCREYPGYDAVNGTGPWTGVCFPELLAEIGENCLDVNGQPDPAACAAGQCESIGGLGYCTQDCAEGSCPTHALCATLTGAQQNVCLAKCDTDHPCDQDPLLNCELEDAAGDWGFTLVDIPSSPTDTYCAPRRCVDDPECSTDGYCDQTTGGFCQPLP